MHDSDPQGEPGHTPITLRPCEDRDVIAIARLHRRAFPDSTLTLLGERVVGRYYEWLNDRSHDAVRLVAVDEEGRVVGFCYGGWFKGAMTGYLRGNTVLLIRALLLRPVLLIRRDVRDRLSHGLRLRTQRSRSSGGTPDHSSFGVLSIAVDPDSWGRGIGQALASELERQARDRGCRSMHLSVHPENARAIGFYRSLGFRPGSNGSERMEKAL